jgi:hypothetical protein
MWTQTGIPRTHIEIGVHKQGRGVYVTYGWRDTKGLEIANFPAKFNIGLIENWAIAFGHQQI